MNAKYLRIVAIAGLVLASLATATKVAADPPPDILDAYTISVSPGQDGTLAMSYVLENYCTKSDWPGDQPYLQIGVPNGNFSIADWGPKDGVNKVVKAESVTEEGSFVQLDFDRGNLPKNGDCFNLNFSIVQNKMAYPDPENGNVTFKFIPAGWKFPIQVKKLTLNWALPSDPSLVKLADPSPMGKDTAKMTWQWDNPAMDANSMFNGATVKLAYDKSAFSLSDAATTKTNGANGGDYIDPATCWTIVIVVVVLIILLLIVLAVIESVDSGDSLGTSFGTVIGGVADIFSDGGGYGGSSGHSSGCACAGCACACACAGGGKVGCSRKGIGIKCLEGAIAELTGK